MTEPALGSPPGTELEGFGRIDSKMITTNPESNAPSLPYLGGIDGLRALAVVAVLLYHGGITWMPAGFLGVEVFFAISGFLITALLLGEYDKTGTISLRNFWLRRAWRLLPALFVLLIGVVAITYLLAPDVIAQVGRELWAAVLYISNWFFIADQQSYFETFGRPSPLRHLWSLAVEEQFYLIWPVVLLFLLKKFRRRWVLAIIVIGVILSTALMIFLWEPHTDPTRVYYGTDTRAAGLLVGAATAFLLRRFLVYAHGLRRFKELPWLPDVIAGAALVGLVTLFMVWDAISVTLYRGGFLFTSILTVVVIAMTTLPGSRLGRFLGSRPLTWIGTRSYALYLWHWPIFVVTRARLDVTIDGFALLTLRLVLTACLAELSYRLVERRFRYRRSDKPRVALRRPAMGAAAATGTVVFIVLTVFMMGAPQAPATEDDLVATADSVLITSPPETSAAPTTRSSSVESTQPTTTTRPENTQGPTTLTGGGAFANRTTTSPSPDSNNGRATTAPGSKKRPTTTPPGPSRTVVSTQTTQPRRTTTSTTMTTTTTTTTTTTPEPTLPDEVLFIGDSVMLGAHETLQDLDTTVAVDARVSRQWWDVVDEVDVLGTEDQPSVVVLHLGTNGTVDAETLDVAMGTIVKQEGTRVLIVNARVPQLWEADVNEQIAAGVERWPAAVLVDWYSASDDHLQYFVSDGVHLTAEGRDAYANLIEQTLLELR